jgi:hypothetical protein
LLILRQKIYQVWPRRGFVKVRSDILFAVPAAKFEGPPIKNPQRVHGERRRGAR